MSTRSSLVRKSMNTACALRQWCPTAQVILRRKPIDSSFTPYTKTRFVFNRILPNSGPVRRLANSLPRVQPTGTATREGHKPLALAPDNAPHTTFPVPVRCQEVSPPSNEVLSRATQTLGKQELLNLLDEYQDNVSPDSTNDPHNLRIGPGEVITLNEGEGGNTNHPASVKDTRENFRRFEELVHDVDVPLNSLYKSYLMLPQPCMLRFSQSTRTRLLRRFGVLDTAQKDEKAMLRYLSLLEDMKRAGLPLDLDEWNTAVHLAGRCFSRITSQEVEAALRIWKEMEQSAGITSNVVTFNILFDVATKASQFMLADMVMQEILSRQLPLNRFSHTSIIYYYGSKGDGPGIRKSYKALVNANQLVDTSVLNCVIASLIRADELPAAMNVYNRMKAVAYGSRDDRKHRTRRSAKKNGRSLDKLIKKHGANQAVMQKLQNNEDLAPDVKTYIILVQHHVSYTGELHTVATLLDEMHELGIPIHGRIFLELFRGFSEHGAGPYTPWTKVRLRGVWDSFLALVDRQSPDIYVAKWMVIWVIRAFEKCHGRAKSLEISEELRRRWHTDYSDEISFDSVIYKALGHDREYQ